MLILLISAPKLPPSLNHGEVPEVRNSLPRALGNVSPSQSMGARLFDFHSPSSVKASPADELDAAIGAHNDSAASTLVPVTLDAAD